jgi:hypothetical protein
VLPILNTLGTANQGGMYVEHGVFARRVPDGESGHAVTTTAADTHGFLSGHSLDENLKLRHRLYRDYKHKADRKYQFDRRIFNSHCYAAIKVFLSHRLTYGENYRVPTREQLPLGNVGRIQEARRRRAAERARFGS